MDGLREVAAGGGSESKGGRLDDHAAAVFPVRVFFVPETYRGVDGDEEDAEDLERLLEVVTGSAGVCADEEDDREENQDEEKAVSEKEMEAYAVIADMTISRLPSGSKVAGLVVHSFL